MTEQQKLEPGMVVWLSDGREANYFGESKGQHLVQPLLRFESYDGDFTTDYGPIEAVPTIHRKAPIAVVDAEIAEKRKTLKEINKAICEARSGASRVMMEENAAKARRQNDSALKFLDGMLAGTYTHAVLCTDQPTFGTIAAILGAKQYSHYDLKPARISTINAPDKPVKFSLTVSNSSVEFFASEDEAKARAQGVAIWRLTEKMERGVDIWSARQLQYAIEIGAPVPPEWLEALKKFQRGQAIAGIAAAKAKVDEANAALAALEKEATA